ncbi:hypothetical protein B0H14DRAFT_2572439 [Mycena olivaceomarginata]|nr:hypothetical protein B0H14DRAFT_2572439 [Mycena olivaceomarginata]
MDQPCPAVQDCLPPHAKVQAVTWLAASPEELTMSGQLAAVHPSIGEDTPHALWAAHSLARWLWQRAGTGVLDTRARSVPIGRSADQHSWHYIWPITCTVQREDLRQPPGDWWNLGIYTWKEHLDHASIIYPPPPKSKSQIVTNGWVELYATNLGSLVSALIRGIWPDKRLAEWPVVAQYSQHGDSHLMMARILPAAAEVGIAGKWKTEPILQHHLSAMVIPHILPLAEAPKADAILKKLGLHISSTFVQTTSRNRQLPPHDWIVPIKAHYGVVFTGKTCVVAQEAKHRVDIARSLRRILKRQKGLELRWLQSGQTRPVALGRLGSNPAWRIENQTHQPVDVHFGDKTQQAVLTTCKLRGDIT